MHRALHRLAERSERAALAGAGEAHGKTELLRGFVEFLGIGSPTRAGDQEPPMPNPFRLTRRRDLDRLVEDEVQRFPRYVAAVIASL